MPGNMMPKTSPMLHTRNRDMLRLQHRASLVRAAADRVVRAAVDHLATDDASRIIRIDTWHYLDLQLIIWETELAICRTLLDQHRPA